MRRRYVGLVLVGLITCVIAPVAAWQNKAPSNAAQLKSDEDDEIGYLCPMHPDFTSEVPGRCARCGMKLVTGTLFDMRDNRLEFSTVPAVVEAGKKITLNFKIFHPGTGQLIRKFELVHEKAYHLFVISRDMKFFEHIHPTQKDDGAWTIDVVLPKPGYYEVLSDFLPSGGSGQFLARPLVTAGFSGDLMGNSARLVPDMADTQTVGDLKVKLSYDPGTLQAGSYGHLTYYLTNAATDQPVRDLQTYLGAFGHTLILSEDMEDYVHSHPVGESLTPEIDLEAERGGPTVMFEALMPKPGRYRAWTQFRYHNKVHTVANTFEVFDVGQSAAR
jgi:hypothetical protein